MRKPPLFNIAKNKENGQNRKRSCPFFFFLSLSKIHIFVHFPIEKHIKKVYNEGDDLTS